MRQPPVPTPVQRSWIFRAIVGLVLCAAYLSGALEPVERHLADLRFQLVGTQSSDEIVIVAIDAASLQATPTWPWPRRLHAEAIDRLVDAGARQIAIDVDFSSPTAPDDDQALADAIARAGQRVILPVFEQPSNGAGAHMVATAPLAAMLSHARIASVNVAAEDDGIVRRMARFSSWSGHAVPTLPTVLSGDDQNRAGTFYIDFGIDTGKLTTVSFIDLLSGRLDPAIFKDKSVLIGATALELGDQLATPVEGIVPGVFLQALATESLLQGRDLRRVSPWIVLAVAIGTYLLVLRLNHRARPATGVLVAAGTITFTLGMPLAVQATLPLMFDTLPGLIAVMAAFEAHILGRIRDLDLRLIRQSAQLSRTDSLMRRVVEATHDGIIVIDGNRRIRSVNPAAESILGKSAGELVGHDFSAVIDDVPSFLSNDADISESDLSGSTEVYLPMPGGAVRTVEVTVRSVAGEMSGTCVAILHDITQLKRREKEIEAARDQAQAANRSKTQFLANMSHELRTPLNAVLGFSEVIKSEMFGPLGSHQYVDYSTSIHDSAKHLLGIINDILDVSSIEAGDRRLAEEIFDPAQVCQSAVNLLLGRIQAAGVTIDLAIAEDVGRLRADRRMVLQIILNLLSNAIKFSPRKGRVTVDVARTGDNGMTFKISDSGIGISEADLKRVMMPFEQVEAAYARKHDGVGLGLPLVTSMAELHGARFQLESELGKGTVATVTFPPERCEPPSLHPDGQLAATPPAMADARGSAPRSAAAH